MNYLAAIVRLYPTPEQESLFIKTVGCCRFVYNHYLALCRSGDGKLPTEAELKREFVWLQEPDANSIQIARQNLLKAFKNWKSGNSSFPAFKKRGKRDSFSVPQKHNGLNIRIDGSVIKLGKCGFVSFNGSLHVEGNIKSATIKLEAGKWYASILYEVDDDTYYQSVDHKYGAIGIDLGVVKPLTITTGDTFAVVGKEAQAKLKQLEARRQRYQRQLARKHKGSNNRNKARARVARAFQRERFYRENWQHQVSYRLTRNAKTIIFEDLKIANMTRGGKGKSGLNREMLRLGLAGLITKCQYKANRRGGEVVFVDPRYTSQMCSECGTVDRQSRESQSRFCCVGCGFTFNADKNAALNILARGRSK